MPNTQEKNYLVLLTDITFRLFTNCQKKEEHFVSNFEITAVEFRCIWFLNEQKEITVKELAQKMSLSSSRVTRIVDGLVDKHLVIREISQVDRRQFNLSLSSKGKKLARVMIKNYTELHKRILKGFAADYKESYEVLNQFNNSIENILQEM